MEIIILPCILFLSNSSFEKDSDYIILKMEPNLK